MAIFLPPASRVAAVAKEVDGLFLEVDSVLETYPLLRQD